MTYKHIIMLACARALREFPRVNASFDGTSLTVHENVNIGLAVALEDGLMVPNVKACQQKGLLDIARQTQAAVAAVKEGHASAELLSGGTFTVTNLGAWGITAFSPLINQPELAILGVTALADVPVVREGKVTVSPMMNLCLTADHRIIDGSMAASFAARIRQLLENPALMLM